MNARIYAFCAASLLVSAATADLAVKNGDTIHFAPDDVTLFANAPTGYVASVMFAFGECGVEAKRVDSPVDATWTVRVAAEDATDGVKAVLEGKTVSCAVGKSFKPDLDGQASVARAVLAAFGAPADRVKFAVSFARWTFPSPAYMETEPRVYTCADGRPFRYRWHGPEAAEPGRKYPLVVLLHGAGERGSENVKQICWGGTPIIEYFKKRGEQFFLVAGQVPKEMQWVDVPWAAGEHSMTERPSDTMARLIEFIAALRGGAEPVDLDRIYATGISMGGYGTFDLVSRKPEWFAAAMPICGGGDTAQAVKLRDLPIFIHHGDVDDAVPVWRGRSMIAALRAAGSYVARYTEYPGCSHFSWGPAYGDEKNLEWLFSKRRVARPAWTPVELPANGGVKPPARFYEVSFKFSADGGASWRRGLVRRVPGFPLTLADDAVSANPGYVFKEFFSKDWTLQSAPSAPGTLFRDVKARPLPERNK